MEDRQKTLIKRIDSLCKEKGMNYYTLACKANIPLTTLMHIMSGRTKNPGVFTILKLCDGFEMPVKEFFDIEEFMEELG